MVEKRWITEKEVAEITGRAAQTLRNDRVRRRGIPYYKHGGSVRYLLQDVYSTMEEYRVNLHGGSTYGHRQAV